MHFRVRKNVIQLIRVAYDAEKKKGSNAIIGSVDARNPKLTVELQQKLLPDEIAAYDMWLEKQHRVERLREEMAALMLIEHIELASRWFQREGESSLARSLAGNIAPQWQALRKIFLKNKLLD